MMWTITIVLAVGGVVKAKLNCWLQPALETRIVTSAAGPCCLPQHVTWGQGERLGLMSPLVLSWREDFTISCSNDWGEVLRGGEGRKGTKESSRRFFQDLMWIKDMGISGGKLTVVDICMCQSRQPDFPGAISTFKMQLPALMLYFPQISAQSHITGWMERARLQRLDWGLVT